MEHGWHSRLYLPHFEAEDVPQFVSFRLADALPREVLERWKGEVRQLQQALEFQRLEAAAAEQRRQQLMTSLNRRIEAYVDTGHGEALLRDPRLASIVEQALLYFDGQRYSLHAWIVMPNHVHALFTPSPGWFLSQILMSWKSFTSKQIGKILGRTGRIWQREYFDRMIRSGKHYWWTVDCIERNPVEAGFCEKREDWVFSSARRRVAVERAASAGT
jgi:putative DNA methylase